MRSPGSRKAKVGRQIGVGAGMRLHVGVLGRKQLLGTIDGQPLDFVDELAAAVVPLPRIALGVFVGQHAADRLEHGRADEVLGCDQLDAVTLARLLAGNGAGHFWVRPSAG